MPHLAVITGRVLCKRCASFAEYWTAHAMKTLQVKVKPNSRECILEELSDGTWLARVKAQPVDGKANRELVALIARHFKLRKAQVSVKSGAAGRMKVIRIDD